PDVLPCSEVKQKVPIRPHYRLDWVKHKRSFHGCKTVQDLRIRPTGCLDRRGYCQDRGRPPCRTLGRLTRRGDKSRIKERPADVWRSLHWLTFRPQRTSVAVAAQ